MDTEKIIDTLKSSADFYEVHEIKKFRGFRTNEKVSDQEVEITIQDMGPDAKCRYSCRVVDTDGKKAFGNASNSLFGAITNVHWSDIEK